MATFTLEEGTMTVGLATICALRMRVSKSAMGSLMLMFNHSCLAYQLALVIPGISPAKAISRILARARPTPGDGAAVALACRVRVARELLQTQAGGFTLCVAALGVAGDGLELHIF